MSTPVKARQQIQSHRPHSLRTHTSHVNDKLKYVNSVRRGYVYAESLEVVITAVPIWI